MAQQTIAIHPTLSRIRERGYWRTIIRPSQFEAERIGDPQQLPHIVEQCASRFRGWEFPNLGSRSTDGHGNDWIDHATDQDDRREYWRLYQSGQFLHYAALSEDWQSLSFRWHRQSGGQPGELLPVYDSLFRLTEVFDFATNLALSRLYNAGSVMHIELLIQPLKHRQLYNDAAPERTIFLTGIRPAEEETFHRSLDLSLGELIADARLLAVQNAERLFRLFHWQATPGLLQRMQEEFSER